VFDVYVTTNPSVLQPNQNNYMWHATLTEGSSLVIAAQDVGFCTSCSFHIGIIGQVRMHACVYVCVVFVCMYVCVHSRSPSLYVCMYQSSSLSEFIVKMSTQGGYDILIDGSHLHDTVTQGAYKYFEMFVGAESSNFSLLLEPCTGEVDMYVSQDTYRPTTSQYRWRSIQHDEVDMLQVEDKSVNQASFFIGVYAVESSSFKIHSTAGRPAGMLHTVLGLFALCACACM